ncbi:MULTISPECIES: hypothetical protein [unclassified Paenibacillus]|uniref:hypothetical protein n=1 Tax=unclassified Paenibacillus TaxID=185978 RepID=UPI0027867357|nr:MULTISPECIES: hypothetical protein [unclassified Paenibacillus]MDQ0896405.1 hypothetical protein [Paenibacillus sp. V4I7]MDQ0914051.1 hypothetical protein [Paenibacillus sp. V4I5]
MTDHDQSVPETIPPKRATIKNQDTLQKMEWMKEKLNISTDTDLVSVSLSLLHMCIELQEKGYEIGGYKEKGIFGEREYRMISLNLIR